MGSSGKAAAGSAAFKPLASYAPLHRALHATAELAVCMATLNSRRSVRRRRVMPLDGR